MTVRGSIRAAGRAVEPNITASVLNEHMDELKAPGLLDAPAADVIVQYRDRLVEGAKRYASYDRSDPFTMDRCCAHIRQGLCKSINPFREEIDEEGNKRMVPTGLPWHWDEPIYETIRRPDGVIDLRETGRKRHCRTEIIGDAGAPGHYDALVLTSMRDGEIEIIHKNLRRP